MLVAKIRNDSRVLLGRYIFPTNQCSFHARYVHNLGYLWPKACDLWLYGFPRDGFHHNMMVLIVGRTVQGIGGGGLETLCEIILTDVTTLKEQALCMQPEPCLDRW
jgi:MFS family permease